ncbi:MAG TPA: hypothetical protein VFF16_19460 [Telluria sp.]|nr:hypothetical protein [Telluria sp.]
MLASAAFFLAGCASLDCRGPVAAGTFTLALDQPVALSPAVRLTLDEVEDSRCPAGTRCIWAGRIAYRVSLRGCGKDEPFTLAVAGQYLASTTLPGVRIALAGHVQPVPPAPPPSGRTSIRSVVVSVANAD